MNRSRIGRAVVLTLALAIAGCGGGAIEEGVPKDTGYVPPKEMPVMSKPPTKAQIQQKVKQAEGSTAK